jgi:hypothetical protein
VSPESASWEGEKKMIRLDNQWKSVTDREMWAARGASFMAKVKATKVVWFPPEPVKAGKKTATRAKKATKGAAKKSTGAARRTKNTTKSATRNPAKKTAKRASGAARKATGAAR